MVVIISGQKYFGECVLSYCLSHPSVEVAAVCCPVGDKYIGRLAAINGIPIIPGGSLCADTMPVGIDLGICAHSFDYIGKKTRYAARLGWIGYHPSLLPRHRGRSSIEWALRFNDFATGGTVFWLNSGIDRGDIERQELIWVKRKYFHGDIKANASALWANELLPLGVKLMGDAIDDISRGVINRKPQNAEFSTWEPCTKVNDIYRPDALMLPPGRLPGMTNPPPL